MKARILLGITSAALALVAVSTTAAEAGIKYIKYKH